jgi:uncharacterized protein YndB with AHSA1/START domain
MTAPSVSHATFVIERSYPAPAARVFAAWVDPVAKRRWFGGPVPADAVYKLDFRVGGEELSRDRLGEQTFTYLARYQNIVPDQRIIFTYDMQLDDAPISVSVATVELKPENGGTRLIYTEQGAFLDGLDTPEQREHGTAELLDALGTALVEDGA